MVYAFKTHESSAGDTVGKLRWIAGKAMKSTSASSETAKMARLVMAKTVQGDERTVTMGAIRCSFLYISMSMQRGVVLGVYTPNRRKKSYVYTTRTTSCLTRVSVWLRLRPEHPAPHPLTGWLRQQPT